MTPPDKDALGVCLGASSIGLAAVRLEQGQVRVLSGASRPHEGDPKAALLSMLDQIPGWTDLPVAATGRKFRKLVRLPSLSEPEAVELAAGHVLGPDSRDLTVLSAGGESFLAYRLDGRGLVCDIQSGNKCASGTGEFLLQQLARMGLTVKDLADLDHAAAPYKVSGRCSVFCKSDCTHALNKGAPKGQVVAGLGRMMAVKCLELIRGLPKDRLLLTGGCAANPYLVRFLRQEIGQLVIPAQAAWFEALGAALWALANSPAPPGSPDILLPRKASFAVLAPLRDTLGLVDFKDHPRGRAEPGDEVLCGLDVGSTTTKGVLVRRSDLAILAGEYLRTDGDPIGAARKVYAGLAAQLDAPVTVTALGVTGSGRAIAGLHAGATAAINEIVAHAAAAAYYDPEVDTIFEIGGQDAKYTFLANSFPCDSAMNEACSAGTGSFLEESAKESLNVATTDIGELALTASGTPNFNDQCAAFIGSDIKLAVQEGVPVPDILAGLVYSVCQNYVVRVKGNRPVGSRVFMQGGVCYNRAVPAAMAALTGKRIVVPPDPGLMGAFGVALEVDRRIREGHLASGLFDLPALAGREARRKEPFTCRGGKGGQLGCDRGCAIARIEIDGRVHPFGGICNRFENLRLGRDPVSQTLDGAQSRQRRVFRDNVRPDPAKPTVGLSRSYLTNTYFPLYRTFFQELGFSVLMPDGLGPVQTAGHGSPLCFPAELAHGYMAELLRAKPEAVFLPHVKAVPLEGDEGNSCTCVLLQGEPFYLKGAFPALRHMGERLLTPTLDFSHGLAQAEGAFLDTATRLGADRTRGRQAFQAALEAQQSCQRDLEGLGRDMLARLEDTPGQIGVVLFGRSYSAFAAEANKGIPEKLATRGAMVIPCDLLPLAPQPLEPGMNMYWGLGRTMLKAANFAAGHPRMFGVYVTNFSCGPDSFLLGYFRDCMGRKPSVTLELDSHTADAGLETRLEAFLDIAANHMRLGTKTPARTGLRPQARMETRQGAPGVVPSSGPWLPLTHKRVRLVFPSMNPYASVLAAKAVARGGVRGLALPPAGEEALKLGRGHSSCKECLPLQLTLGTLLKHLEERPTDEVTAYFMPSAQGPCRFGQYHVYTARLLAKLDVADAAVLSPCADNGYAGLSRELTMAIWRAGVIGDVFEEMRATLLAAAVDREEALAALDRQFQAVVQAGDRPWGLLKQALARAAWSLARIPLTAPYRDLPKVALLGEIYVRHDPLSRQGLVERLAAKGLVVRTSPLSEWVFYTDWLLGRRKGFDPAGALRGWFKRRAFWAVRQALAPSGLFARHAPSSQDIIAAAQGFISPELTGEAILTVGAAFHEILSPAVGVLAIGPFGCMPTRLAEAVLAERFNTEELARLYPGRVRAIPGPARGKLPFLAVETDGNPFPQLIEARLEAFCLQALRLHQTLSNRS